MNPIWLKNYPQNVAHEIDTNEYNSVLDLINESLSKFSMKKAYSCMGKEMTFQEVDKQATAMAAYFQSIGLKAGDKIAIMMPNLLQYPITLFAAIRAGLVVVNTNPLYTDREMKHQFVDSGAVAIVICENFAFNLEKIIADTQIKHTILVSIGEMLGLVKGTIVNLVVRQIKKMVPPYKIPSSITFSQAISKGKKLAYKPHSAKADDLLAIQYTGGTTGVSKGAMLSHRNLIANMLQVKVWMGDKVTEGQEIILTPLPLYHIYSFTVNCLCLMALGGMNVLVVNPRDQKALFKDLLRYPYTMMTGVNTLFNAMLNNPEIEKINFSTWKIVSAGAMALQRPVYDRFLAKTGVAIAEGYGMTEASPVVSTNPFDGSARVGTIGMPVPSTQIRIMGEDGIEKGIGEPGEIQVKGPQVMSGYYNNQDETDKVITKDGWLCTGDVGIIDEDGFIKIVDRIKDMILVSGFNVYPNEIEEILCMHPKVLEAAAIGIPDEHSGEVVKVFIVKKDPSLSIADIKNHCSENLTNYKCPKIIEFREDLPKTPVGKILRRALRDS
jgi:long-chain acyl-CoA synthetase